LTVTVEDPDNAVVPGAKITLTDLGRGVAIERETTGDGIAAFQALHPGDYSLKAEKSGFDAYTIDRLTLQVRDRQEMRLKLRVAQAETTSVVVTAQVGGISNDTAQGVSLDQHYVENLPANGRNAESLILMAPGITSATGSGDDFNANGLRSNTNYYTLDGVSLNQSGGGGGPGGGGPGGGGPPGGGGMPGGGGPPGGGGMPGGMISIDAMQEMKVQTSSMAPEFGRTPGAQVVMTSRGGGNGLHGTLFDYERSDGFDANNWFANAGGFGKGREREERPGGTLGGHIIRNKTFYFLSYEQLKLQSPQTIVANVPDLASRSTASAALRPYLKAYPIPNGQELTDDAAVYNAVVSNPSRSRSYSARLDHSLGASTSLFARFSLDTSNSQSRGSDMLTPNVVSTRSSHSQQYTLGATRTFGAGAVEDLRMNFSSSSGSGLSRMDNYGGAVPLTDSQVFPSGVTSETGSFSLGMQGLAGYTFGGGARGNRQTQFNIVDSISRDKRNHHLKAGVDFRKQWQMTGRAPYSLSVNFDGVTGYDYSFLGGEVLNAMVSSNETRVYPAYNNFSLYGQDSWQLTDRTTVTYGLRWDVNPAPTPYRGPKPFAVSNDSIAGVTQNDPLYATRWFNIAPRVGLAYLSDDTPGREMMFRLGAGVFYDMGYGVSNSAFSSAPYSNAWTFSKIAFPLDSEYTVPPTMPPTRPYGQITAGETGLAAPVVYQYNATWEKNFGASGTMSVGINGNKGSKLMQTETYNGSTGYQVVRLVTNGSSSSYHGLQVQYRRRLGSNLQTQLSYTWSHAMDTSSNDFGGGFATIAGSNAQGPSDYDIRQNLSLSGSLLLPAPKKGFLLAPLRHWYLDFVFSTRTGLPFDIIGITSCTTVTSGTTITTTPTSPATCSTTTSSTSSSAMFSQVRPDVVGGRATWIGDTHAPGGKRLNMSAFSVPSSYAQGNLGRNALRGFGYAQLDLSLRRVIPISERARVTFAAEGYNITNHPNFANPSRDQGANMSSPSFGVATRMLGQGFGGGVNSLFRSGGPRSMELSLRLQF